MPSCARCGFESDQAVRFCPECGAEQAAASSAGEQRRIVTVLFCDLTGSTALGESLDPERLRALLARYFERMQGIVESHGGTVEKFIGDAVMAVFGVPTVHEDDALRAVRAAVEMRDALPELGLQGRIGVMTGEVVTGTAERLVTGDPVNVAARLEQAAEPGTVLIGQTTLRLVSGAVEVETIEPLTLKGKSEPVAAHRLVAVHDAPERRHDTPFVGRERELSVLEEAWSRVTLERCCELVTVVGEAGVGKSRLAAELLTTIDATVARGRCLPYGEGITYWPVIEVLHGLGVRPPDQAAAAAISSLLGEGDVQTSAEELAWAFRKTLEHAAAEQPVVVVFDDVQWGEQTFHDLIEHLALLSSGAPILLLCMARPELTEHHPTWPVSLRLQPLDHHHVDELIGRETDAGLRARIADAAGGNPLFVLEMLAVTTEAQGEIAVPPTMQALLQARLEQLDPAERVILERASIEGEIFHRGAIQALTPDGTPVTPSLAALARKQLIRPERAQIVGDDGFRFHHLLLRDTAYHALPKATRADLHERLARWLEPHLGELGEADEILGYHLEQACTYHEELGVTGEHADALALRAGRLLGSAGRRAHARGDDGAARSLLGRATRLLPESDPDMPSLFALLGSSTHEGGDTPRALEALHRAQAVAAAMGQRTAELRGRMDELAIRARLDPLRVEELQTDAESAIAELEELDDDEALGRAWRAMIEIGFVGSDFGLVEEASTRLLDCARRTGIRREEVWAVRGLVAALAYGPTPVDEAIARAEEALAGFPLERAGEDHLALLYAYAGRFEDAEQAMERSHRVRADLGQTLDHAGLAYDASWIALHAGRPDLAEQVLRDAAGVFESVGERDYSAGLAATLAEVLYRLGRYEEAEDWARRSEETAPTQLYWAPVQAKLLARRGAVDEALQLAAAGVAQERLNDHSRFLGDALCDQAETLVLLGRPDDARTALVEALEQYERKGIVPLIERARARLAELEQDTAPQ